MGERRPCWLGNLKHTQEYLTVQDWPSDLPQSKAAGNLNVVYTSDYGSYSSQESNHSGTTNYSNLVDCEEALRSLQVQPGKDAVPMQRVDTRRNRPLPPPRRQSQGHRPYQSLNQLAEPERLKKISFDDSMTKRISKQEQTTPSFATLPRKKKLAKSNDTAAAQTPVPAQTDWMKAVAQKEEILRLMTSKPASNGEKPRETRGILKNKTRANKAEPAMIPEPQKSQHHAYISRNTVQKILDQQRVALNRKSHDAPPNRSQLYTSMPNMKPSSLTSHHQKAWEHNFHSSLADTTTAQVLGVIEPGAAAQPVHLRQNSAETDFEFPPPPSDTDIAQILSAVNGSEPSSVQPLANGVLSHHPPPDDRELSAHDHTMTSIDVVLPPPLEFQGSHEMSGYGDYEILTDRNGHSDPYLNGHERSDNSHSHSSSRQHAFRPGSSSDSRLSRQPPAAQHRSLVTQSTSQLQYAHNSRRHPPQRSTYYSLHHQQYSTEL